MKRNRTDLAEIRELVGEFQLDELEERRIVMPLLLKKVIELEAEVKYLNEIIKEMTVSENRAKVAKKAERS